MKIAVLGCGAIGSLYAASLAQDPSNEVLCIVRSEQHASLINSSGINIISNNGCSNISASPRAVTDTENEVPADIVLIAIKSYATEDAVAGHAALFGPDTIALTLQNGYGNHLKILNAVPKERIIMGTTAMGVNIDSEGHVILAGTGKTVIGSLAPETETGHSSLATVKKLLSDAGFDIEETSDAQGAVLDKLLINVGINAVCALNDVPNRFICDDPDMRARAEALVREAVEVLNDALGKSFDPDSVWCKVLAVAEKTGLNVCSMLQDVRKNSQTEISAINGAIVDIASQAGLEAPVNAAVTDEILMLTT